MRSCLLICAVVLVLLSFASGKPGKHHLGSPVVHARTNSEALRSGLALPRPASVPMRCARNNATCIEELRSPRIRKRQANPSQTAVASPPQQFQRSCTNARLSGTTNPMIQANCRTQTGSVVASSFTLNTCVSYTIGLACSFVPSADMFQDLCNNCALSGTTLTCNCGIFIKLPYSIDLAQCLGNNNGVLKCAAT